MYYKNVTTVILWNEHWKPCDTLALRINTQERGETNHQKNGKKWKMEVSQYNSQRKRVYRQQEKYQTYTGQPTWKNSEVVKLQQNKTQGSFVKGTLGLTVSCCCRMVLWASLLGLGMFCCTLYMSLYFHCFSLYVTFFTVCHYFFTVCHWSLV